MLYFVATPIGNLEDITLRALRILKEADFVYAEDTRKANNLLKHYNISSKVKSFHEHNKKQKTEEVIRLFEENNKINIAVISEAGTPAISDPGYYLIREAINNSIEFTSIPGACSVTNALVLSGIGPDQFFFAGFLSAKKAKRKKELVNLSKINTTIIFFESKYRINATLKDLDEIFKDKKIAVAKEMTKIYEKIYRQTAANILKEISSTPKGEFVVIIDNRGKNKK